MNNIRSLIILPILLISIIATFVIQFKLSKQKSRWVGLVFPFVFTMIAAFLTFGVTIYDGDIVKLLLTFILYMIPADIHILIYILVRNKEHSKNERELDKMKIQDL